MKGHTYVNVPISPPPLSPQEDSNYENCEFLRSVARWKQSDGENGSRRKSLPTEPKENQRDLKPPATNKARESSSVAPERTNDYVNLEFPSRNEANSSLSPHAPAAKPLVSVKPSFLQGDSNKAAVNSNAMKGGVASPLSGRQQAPTISDYEILPSNAGTKSGNAGIAIPKYKGSAGDYEILAQSASRDKKEAKLVPEGRFFMYTSIKRNRKTFVVYELFLETGKQKHLCLAVMEKMLLQSVSHLQDCDLSCKLSHCTTKHFHVQNV